MPPILRMVGGAPAEGPGEGGGGEEAPIDFTKPQQTIQSPDRQYKAPTDYTKPQQTILSPNRLYKDMKY